VREGGELARSEVSLPSDRWRDGEGSLSFLAGRNGKKKRVRWGEGLRWEEGERDAGFSLRSIVRWEPAYAVKVVDEPRGKGRRRNARETERVEVGMEVRTPQQAEEAPVESSDSGDECDVLVDFSGNEADGWVPVMVAEEDEGEDWMSLTGSWVLMRGRGEAKKNTD
jgi:hypothetical protein